MSSEIVCPYCRMSFDETGPAKIYCSACGVPHHEDCYQENGGCTVFGCARAPADDPKMQVSYNDLNAVAAQTSRPVQPEPMTPVPRLPPRYQGPLGLSALPTTGYAGPAAEASSSLALTHAAQAYAQGRQPKSRSTYIVLGIFLGALGVHNFYAGYTGRAVGQLCLSVLTLFSLAIVSWIWAIVEICIVEKDSAGIQFS
jgi:TM2 domain-containing membrane protein YozV